jgi:hypothetical protein
LKFKLKAWGDALFRIAVNLVYRNAGVMHFLNAAYAKIRYASSATTDIPVEKFV